MPETQTERLDSFAWKPVDEPVPGGIPRETLEKWIRTYFRKEENLDEFGMRSSACLELMAKDGRRGYGFLAPGVQHTVEDDFVGLLARINNARSMNCIHYTWVDFLFVDSRKDLAGYSWSR